MRAQGDDNQTVWRDNNARRNDGLCTARRIIVDLPTANLQRCVAVVDNLDPFRPARWGGHEFVDEGGRRSAGEYRYDCHHYDHGKGDWSESKPAHTASHRR